MCSSINAVNSGFNAPSIAMMGSGHEAPLRQHPAGQGPALILTRQPEQPFMDACMDFDSVSTAVPLHLESVYRAQALGGQPCSRGKGRPVSVVWQERVQKVDVGWPSREILVVGAPHALDLPPVGAVGNQAEGAAVGESPCCWLHKWRARVKLRWWSSGTHASPPSRGTGIESWS